jgi:hypothetical protein
MSFSGVITSTVNFPKSSIAAGGTHNPLLVHCGAEMRNKHALLVENTCHILVHSRDLEHS